ncbi:MAG TPA: TIGR03087 family PEP-CTERM/XrtA system glycosyltransferase [Croceibacterium sp.]|nr:TIGR03087 family PEP-CTERM/XrtA system glycosyltransferase [Croceibacterium sp.]
MSGILVLAHRLPFPPDSGDKTRTHHVLKALARLAPVHVGCFGETVADKTDELELAELAESHCMVMRDKPLALAGAEALARRQPVSLAAYRDGALRRWVTHTLARHAIDTIYVFSARMGQFVPQGWTGKLVVDLVEVDSARFESHAGEKNGPVRWLNAREARLLGKEEARLAARADRTLLVSSEEAALFAGRLPSGSRARVSVLGHGIDAVRFDPARKLPYPAMAGPGPHVVFTGQMDRPSNIDAALRTVERVLPLIRMAHPTVQFHLVGGSPVPELTELDGADGVRVWGEVPDVRPFLAGADLMLAAQATARGVQNEVLEALAMARPVVLTPAAASGIPGRDGVHFAIAEADEALGERARALLARQGAARAMGQAARRLVIEKMSWPAVLAPLPAIVGRARERRNAA